MNKFILALVAASALSSAALAERSYDLRDSAEARGTFSVSGGDVSTEINTLPQVGDEASTNLLFGKYGIAENEAELRRWDEKNGG